MLIRQMGAIVLYMVAFAQESQKYKMFSLLIAVLSPNVSAPYSSLMFSAELLGQWTEVLGLSHLAFNMLAQVAGIN